MTASDTPYSPSRPYGIKILYLGLITAALMIGALVILSIENSRQTRSKTATDEIAALWGRAVMVTGPSASMPYQERREADADAQFMWPASYNCTATVRTDTLHRNNFETLVFNSDIEMSGTFRRDSLMALNGGDPVEIRIGLPLGQVTALGDLEIGGQKLKWTKESQPDLAPEYIVARIFPQTMPEDIEFSTSLSVRGSGEISIDRAGDNPRVTIRGEASHPSFGGAVLPQQRDIDGSRFMACWDTAPGGETTLASVKFLTGVDYYQKVERSLKYAFLIILLTFAGVMYTEVLMRREIPLLNYFLTGAALVLFYLLLLSLSEFIGFGWAYLAAAAMTVALIALYLGKTLGSAKVTLLSSVLLAAEYGICYVLMTLETYSLLLGSLVLFATLGAGMWISLKAQRKHAPGKTVPFKP